MVASDLERFTDGEGHFGENVARTQRILARLLLDWSRAHGGAVAYLTAIPFDKLAEFFCRVWDDLGARGLVRYASALSSYRGFHGPGRAMSINRLADEAIGKDPRDHRFHQLAYTTEIIEKLQPAVRNARALFRIEGEPWEPTCRIYAGMDGIEWDAWISNDITDEGVFLTAAESQFVEDLGRVVAGLDQQEIRIVGTHHTAMGTVKDLEFNLRHWKKRFDQLVTETENLDSHTSDRVTHQLVSLAREIRSKSDRNSRVYGRARGKLTDLCKSTDLAGTFNRVYDKKEDLWGNAAIIQYKAAAGDLLDLSLYVRRGVSEVKARKLSAKESREGRKALDTLLRNSQFYSIGLSDYSALRVDGFQDWLEQLERIWAVLEPRFPPVGVRNLGIP